MRAARNPPFNIGDCGPPNRYADEAGMDAEEPYDWLIEHRDLASDFSTATSLQSSRSPWPRP
jgi:hypothetical protein